MTDKPAIPAGVAKSVPTNANLFSACLAASV
jgi:hypothetical protein